MEKGNTLNYFQYGMALIKNPDTIITKKFQGYSVFGFVNIVILIILLFFNTLLEGKLMASEDAWYLIELTASIKVVISYTISLGVMMFLLNWIATKVIDKHSISYYLEKLGAVLFFPCLLITLSIVFQFYNLILHAWFQTIGYSFIVLSIFIISYFFAARDNYKLSFLFALGFYFLTELIILVL